MQRRRRWTLVAAVVGSGMVFLDGTIVTVALPRIGQELPTSRFGVLEAQSYVYNGYLLTLSALLVLAGALNDHRGRRRMFGLGLAGFALTSALCALAPTMEVLVLARLLQGAAGAILVPGSLSIITAAFHGEQRGRAFGIWAGASAVTTIVGPLVGGVLVDTLSWRAAFLLNLPLAAVGLHALRSVEESRDPEATGRVDWVGAAFVALAVGGLTFGAIRGQERAWQDPTAFAALAAGTMATVALPWHLVRSPRPLVPPRLFRSRNFSVTNASTLVIYGGLYVTLYFVVIFLQGTVGYNASAAGVATVPSMALLAVLSPRLGSLAARHGPRAFMAGGPLVMAMGILWLARVPATTAAWQLLPADPRTWIPPAGYVVDLLPGLLVFGVGTTVVVAPLTTALMNSVPVAHASVASAVNNAISRVGPQLAIAALFVAITARFYTGLADRTGLDPTSAVVRESFSPLNPPAADVDPRQAAAARQASTESFRLAMVVAAGLTATGALINAVGIRNEQFAELAEEDGATGAPPGR